MSRRTWCWLAFLVALLAAAVLLRLLSWDRGLDSFTFLTASLRQCLGLDADSSEAWFIRFRLRMVISALTIGAGLALSGVLLQALLRNPLAAPSILGLSSGAGLGVVTAMCIAYAARGVIVTGAVNVGAAVIGAFAALLVVYALGQRRGLVEPVTLLLSGVIVSIICGALIVALYQFLPDQGMAAAMRWMMGKMAQDVPTLHQFIAGIAVALSLIIAIRIAPALDVATLGDEEAHSIGVALPRLRLTIFALAGIMTGVTVLLAGPVGFVGLICPHVARRLVGPGHRAVVIAAALLGALLVILADIASTLTAPLAPAG
ncbi:MAG: iron ABC transporter permease, partial [Phycisphaerales bacterium]|nr:iron ABC transporter permease [Phycisphaerales bacterium]